MFVPFYTKEKLKVYGSQISMLSNQGIINLRIIDLGHNELSEFPEFIFDLKNLQKNRVDSLKLHLRKVL